jgi:hypothetical protein
MRLIRPLLPVLDEEISRVNILESKLRCLSTLISELLIENASADNKAGNENAYELALYEILNKVINKN